MRDVMALDSSGMHALKDVALTGSAVLTEIGSENVFSNLDEALTRARTLAGYSSPMA